MMRNLINEKLVQSSRFAPGKKSGDESSTDNDQPGTGQPLKQILSKEEEHVRHTAQENSITAINQHREQINKGLAELINQYEDRQNALQEELSKLRELKTKIDAMPEEIQADDIKDCKQLLQAADYEVLQHEREKVSNTNFQSISKGIGAQSLTEASFLQLTRTGIALTWPLILAVIAAFSTFGLLMYSIFAI